MLYTIILNKLKKCKLTYATFKSNCSYNLQREKLNYILHLILIHTIVHWSAHIHAD